MAAEIRAEPDGNTGRTRACHRRAYSNLEAGQQSGAVGAAAAPGLRSAGRTARDPETMTSDNRDTSRENRPQGLPRAGGSGSSLRPYGSAHFGPGLAMDTNYPD